MEKNNLIIIIVLIVSAIIFDIIGYQKNNISKFGDIFKSFKILPKGIFNIVSYILLLIGIIKLCTHYNMRYLDTFLLSILIFICQKFLVFLFIKNQK